MKRNRYPPGWSARRVKRVLEHYEKQTDVEGIPEDEAPEQTVLMPIPTELVRAVGTLIERHHRGSRTGTPTRSKPKSR